MKIVGTSNESHDKAMLRDAIPDSERQRCEVWTRVMGYHRPVSSFNIGKKGEFFERRYFLEKCCDLD